jgi:hypothetical protein
MSMGLIKKIFGADKAPSDSTQFRESKSAPPGTSVGRTVSENAPRRDLVQVVLRETMRKHGIPSDWIDCRTLSVLTRQHKQGMHVQFIVRKGDAQLLEYVHAFQASFWREVERFEPRAREWLFSVAWQFEGKAGRSFDGMPIPAESTARQSQAAEDEIPTQPPELEPDEIASDLAALQQAMSQPADLVSLPNAAPRAHRPSGHG